MIYRHALPPPCKCQQLSARLLGLRSVVHGNQNIIRCKNQWEPMRSHWRFKHDITLSQCLFNSWIFWEKDEPLSQTSHQMDICKASHSGKGKITIWYVWDMFRAQKWDIPLALSQCIYCNVDFVWRMDWLDVFWSQKIHEIWFWFSGWKVSKL